ncbi:Stabilin-2 [Merluccius polli]|uniref:Stabilin-2 n=1 Tax=Merluccius polli TaxID=89951 RepID=A0AA47M3U4_MERPO|nr:Stabilin-2 [Merluccius polli]
MRTLTARSKCFSCRISISSSFLFNCPFGFRQRAGSLAQDCTMSSMTGGCSYECYREVKENRCCPGHWGPDCIECPETAERSCSNNGVCSEGMGGNGTCSCKDGFAGTACEDCAPNRYGPNCGSECTCVHGLCNSGLLHDGKCTCFSGYKGDNCDQGKTFCT